MKKKNSGGIKILIIGIVLVCLLIGYYYYLSNKKQDSSEEAAVETTAVQEMLLYNFDRNYPPSPKEVVRLFAEFSTVVYNEEYTEEEFLKLAYMVQELYDDELIANKTPNQYIEDLRWDVNQMKEQEMVISSYSVSSSTDVDFFDSDGYEWARLYCTFTLRTGTNLGKSEEVFLLRKDGEGHWKIYGWTLAEDVNGVTEP